MNFRQSSALLRRRAFFSTAIRSGTALAALPIFNGPARVAAASNTPPNSSPAPAAGRVVEDSLRPPLPGAIQIEGWLGRKLELCLTHGVMAQEIERLVKPFRDRPDGDSGYRCEFWGKWFTSAALGYAYQPTREHRAILDQAAQALLATQTSDGYIGTYDAAHHLGMWDVWGRKYVLLGLIAHYDQTGNPTALDGAQRAADCLLAEAGPGQVRLTDTGVDVLKGLAPSSVLEPMVLLYQRTGDKRYLNFAQDLVAQWSQPSKFAPHGMRLIEDALAGVPPRRIGSPKAYEMMSCFEGVCELYRATGDRKYLEAAVKFGNSLRDTERMINGSGSNQELWCDGARCQTELLEQPQETCVTTTWMKLCFQLLRLTGEPMWADELELSLYNALLGAMTVDGRWWAYFSPLTGERVPSPRQYEDVGLSCCVANGPRALLLTPQWAVMTDKTGPIVNLYAPGTGKVKVADAGEVTITQNTNYPVSDEVALTIRPAAPGRRFTLSLRIPAWSRRSTLTVNGQAVPCQPGTYARLARAWTAGDQVVLKLDLRGRAVPAPSGAPAVAVMRGPILLALDNRLAAPEYLAVRLLADAEGYVDLKPRAEKPDAVWMAFDAPFEVRPTHFFFHRRLAVAMCDFASAGNGWSEESLFRTWLPQPLFLREMFVPGTWKIMYPPTPWKSDKLRPTIPKT
jgi:hypothetical protein